ncbi:hypothetical protein CLG94_12565 [Candidatus Methylomirabilis limnetica]|uniref:Uncharacterized protein n=1 Tax=Candidatus Methylomirabilis limnetica TaxID=2033718 RepID=A0A2T4TUY0_9BACT|nr:hypothetical protein [Candidatus Methylomirabilis limnetica]PTL34923.1 hypothetical protein CLG94_12565 [Candidatus Methylomirabilis limnetica]
MRRLKSTLIIMLLGLTTVVVVGALLLLLFLPTLLQRFACAPYGIRCAVGQVNIRPRPNLTADLVIYHLTLFDPEGPGVALQVKRLAATLNIPALILTRQVMPTEVRIDGPELLLKQLDDGRWNLAVLAQEVQKHLQPTTRPTGLQLPRIALTAGALQIGDHRIGDVNVTLEPKPAPLLFEMQARAVVGGRSVQISGALRNTLDGQIMAQVQEVMLRGALRFRVDASDRAVTIPEWSFETEGAMARGAAAIRYGDWPPAYTLTVAEWGADLTALAHRLSFPWLADLTGMIEGEPTTLQGHWPELPVGEVMATLRGGGLELASPRFGVAGLSGRIGFSLPDGGRPWKAEIMSRSIQLHAATSNGATTLQDAEIAIQGIGMSGRDLTGTLAIGQADLAGRPLRALKARLEIDPDHVRIPEFHVTAGDGDVRGHASFSRAAPLQEARVTLSVRGLRPQSLFALVEKPAGLLGIPFDAELSATLSHGFVTATIDLPPAVTGQLRRMILEVPHTASAAGQTSGHLLLQAQGTLQTGQGMQASGSVRVRGLRELLAGGDPMNQAPPVELAVAYRDSLVTLKAQDLGFSAAELAPLLSRLAGRRIEGKEGRLVISADATFGGLQPPTASGAITLQGLSFSLARQAAEPVPLLTGIRGTVAFTLDRGLLTIKETALRTDRDLTLILSGSLPLSHNDRSATRAYLTVPWTEVAGLRSTLAALTGGQPDATRLAGQLQANLELIGQEYHGALSLRNVSIESNSFHLDSASGVIPLHGRTGSTGSRQVGQGSTSPLHQVATQQRAGWSHTTEREYRTALERLSNVPARAPFSLTIRSLAYDPIELRNIEVALASSGNQIAVQRFAFDASGGRWSGWGTVEPLGGGIALTLLTEGLSLRAICDAFPPIKGYINGRINGMTDLVVPHFAIDQAQGSARFWAVDSPQEKRKISRRLIEQLAGQQIRYFSLFGVPRRYNRGVLEVALKAGDLSFHELEISHTILGYKDLDVRVSPTFNRIGLTHLLESISETIERIRASAETNH